MRLSQNEAPPPPEQGCGPGSAWIHIHFPSRIRIQHVDPKRGEKNFQKKTEKLWKIGTATRG